MRGELDDALARMARREELLRRRSTPPTEVNRPLVNGTGPTGVGNQPPVDGTRYPIAGSRPPADSVQSQADGSRSPVEEIAEAVRRVIAHYPGVTVRLAVERGTSHTALRVGWSDGMVTVTPAAAPAAPATPPGPPAWPLSVKTVPGWAAVPEEHSGDSATRLAELIRRDPSLLHTDEQP
jgi:hypothetical protein